MKSVTTASVACGSVFLFSLWLLVRAMSPHFQLILFFLIALGYECESRTGRRLNKFIRHYEPLYYDPTSLHNIHRRAVERSTHGKFSFSAFGKFHRLNLQPDREIFTADAKILSGDGKPIPFERDSVVRGKVEGRPYSDVYGVISKDDGFHGKILSGSENYYVDPSSWYFDEKQDFPSVMYKEEDLEYEHNFADIKHRVSAFAVPERVRRSLEEQDRSRSRRQSVSELDKNACTLSLYADNFFTKLYGGKTKAIFQLVKQVQAAQIIYTNEFNGTDYFYQKGITFRVKTIVAFNDSEKAPNNLPSQVKDSNVGIDTLLDLFSSIDHSGVCEAFLFTDRDFEGGILGLAWIGDPKGNALGGICDDFVDIGGGKKRSYNTGIVTLKLYGRFTPPRVSEITFAHELGHGFGSQHDPETEACAPGKPDGNFIMFDKATSGIEPNNDRFSPCSKDSIKENVNFKRNKKKDCFVNPKEPLCGNKIVEEGEECDCGNDNTCAEDCCIPANSDPSKKNPGQCFLRGGYVCSPSQGPCCSKMCKYEGPAVVCSVTNGCTKNTSCSGHSFSCDPPEPLKNGTLCDEGRRLCYSGQCSTSVCHRYGLVECSCEVESELCDLCCKEVGGACTSAKRLTQMATELRSLKLVPGTPCDNLNGYCDVFAICRRVDMEGPLLRLKQKFFTVEGLKETVKKYWWAIMLGTIAFCVLIGLFVFLCARYTPSSNPHKEAKKPAKTLPGRKKRNPQQRPGQQGMEMDPRV